VADYAVVVLQESARERRMEDVRAPEERDKRADTPTVRDGHAGAIDMICAGFRERQANELAATQIAVQE
jgi:hypothetical protein